MSTISKILSLSTIIFLPGTAQANNIGSNTTTQQHESIQEQIDAALKRGDSSVTIRPGTYREKAPSNAVYIKISDQKNFQVIARDVELICETMTKAVSLLNCENVTISGLTIDYDPLPFTQGEIIKIAPIRDEKIGAPWIDVKIDTGYPKPNWQNSDRGLIHDPQTHLIKAKTTSPSFERIED